MRPAYLLALALGLSVPVLAQDERDGSGRRPSKAVQDYLSNEGRWAEGYFQILDAKSQPFAFDDARRDYEKQFAKLGIRAKVVSCGDIYRVSTGYAINGSDAIAAHCQVKINGRKPTELLLCANPLGPFVVLTNSVHRDDMEPFIRSVCW